jgi:hypothetical protein
VSILTLDVGTTNLVVSCQRGGHAAPRRVGAVSPGFAGGLTSNVRAELMVVPVILTHSTPTQVATIRALFALGAQVACSGDVFNNASATVVCSGVLSDEFEPAGPWFGPTLTLYEIGQGVAYSGGGTTDWPLSSTPEPSNPSGSTVAPTVPVGDANLCITMLDLATPATCGIANPTCAITYSAVPEHTWFTPALAAGVLSGTPTFRWRSQLKYIAPIASTWAYMGTLAKIYLVRGGVDVGGPWSTDYVGSFWGATGEITMTVTAPIVAAILDMDVLRVELWSRLALVGGAFDDGNRQVICFGAVPGPLRPSIMTLPSSVTVFAP